MADETVDLFSEFCQGVFFGMLFEKPTVSVLIIVSGGQAQKVKKKTGDILELFRMQLPLTKGVTRSAGPSICGNRGFGAAKGR